MNLVFSLIEAAKEVVKANIDKVKSITDKPFGVNIMLLSPFADDIVDLVIEEGVKVVTTGAGNPGNQRAGGSGARRQHRVTTRTGAHQADVR